MLHRTVLLAISAVAVVGNYDNYLETIQETLQKQNHAIAACQEDGFEFSWSSADGAIVCTKSAVSWTAVCSTCDQWRLYVFLDGGRDPNHGEEAYDTEAGNFYCGHAPCSSGWNLPLGGSWANTSSLTLPDARPFNLRLPEVPFLEGQWNPTDYMPNLHARYSHLQGPYSLCIKDGDGKWCFADSSSCKTLSGSCTGWIRSKLDAIINDIPFIPGDIALWQIRTDDSSLYEDIGTVGIESVTSSTTTWTTTVSTVTITTTSITHSSTTTTTMVLTQAQAIAACERDGFSFEWSSGNGAIICTFWPYDWEMSCQSHGADCDNWRLYVFVDGGSDRMHGDGLYESEAGRFYCGRDPCAEGWNLLFGGTWNTTNISLPSLPSPQAVSLVDSGFPDLDGNWEPLDWTPNLQPRYQRDSYRLCQLKYERWCFTSFHNCEHVDTDCYGQVQSKWGAQGKLPHEVDSEWQIWNETTSQWQDFTGLRVELTTSTLTSTTTTVTSSTSTLTTATKTITRMTITTSMTEGPTSTMTTSTLTDTKRVGDYSVGVEYQDGPNVLITTSSNAAEISHCVADGSVVHSNPEMCSWNRDRDMCGYQAGCTWLVEKAQPEESDEETEIVSSTIDTVDLGNATQDDDSSDLLSYMGIDMSIFVLLVAGSSCATLAIASYTTYICIQRRAARLAESKVQDYQEEEEAVADNWLEKKMSSSPVGRRSRLADKEAFSKHAIKIASREVA